MAFFVRLIFQLPFIKSLFRILIGMVAIPVFRMFLKRVVRLNDLDPELEKDLEQWFRGSLLLLVATANMEDALFGWVPVDLKDWFVIGMRIMLAIGVTEAMPDQELFRIIHPGPPKLRFTRGRIWADCKAQAWPCLRGFLCQHLDRSSVVFAILAAIFTGPAGWIFYAIAVIQYLIIGLVTSKDRALDVLSEFDRQVAERRRQLQEEIQHEVEEAPADRAGAEWQDHAPPTPARRPSEGEDFAVPA